MTKLPKIPMAQSALALVIVSLAFFFIGYMLWIQDHTTSEMRIQIEDMIKSHGMPSNQTATIVSALEETEKSNQTTFNILLPVFAAWVTAVVAFYFHTQAQNQAQDTIKQAQDTIKHLSSRITGKLSNMTIAELLKYYPDAKNVVIVKSKDLLKDIQEQCKKFGNVVVTDETGKLLGIIYSSSLLTLGNNQTTLESHFGDIKDLVTGEQWAVGKVINNFAQLTLQDLVSDAKQKMDSIKPNDQRVRGLVIEAEKIIAIVNYQMLTQPLSNL